MSNWLGLCNHQRHIDDGGDSLPECWDCETECLEARLCRCCLASEVELLTDALAVRDRRIEAALTICEQAAKHRTAAYGLDYLNGFNDALDIVEQALRGES